MQYGRSVRWFNDYQSEVDFCKRNNFDFLQVWFVKGNIGLDKAREPKEKIIKEIGFPVIFHALLDINEFEESMPRLVNILKELKHNELIIHPICQSEEIKSKTIHKLCNKVTYATGVLSKEGIKLILENNSKLDPIHYQLDEIAMMFSKNPEVELLLDIAHIDSYDHLKEIIKVKKPYMLHLADKHFGIVHEHLPIGKGDLDFKFIFHEVLNDFNGKIIFEIVDEDLVIIESKEVIRNIIDKRQV